MTEIACDILVVGGSTGGSAAAWAAAAAGATVCLLEVTDWLGGQLTTQGVCTPDEQPYIETFGGTRRYMAFRSAVRDHYRTIYRLTPEAAAQPTLNPGNCWVSRLSFEPRVGAEILRALIRPQEEAGRLQIFYRTRAVTCEMDAAGDTIVAVTARDSSHAEMRFLPRYVLDATDLGDLLPLCGVEGRDWVVGAESRQETGEPDAPESPRPHWIQPFTFPFALDWSPETAATNVIAPPEEYEALKALQNYHIQQGAITGLFAGRLPWWTYRRVLAAENFDDPRIPSDLAMINTAGNDYYGGNVIGPPAANDGSVLRASPDRSPSDGSHADNDAPDASRPEDRNGEDGMQGTPNASVPPVRSTTSVGAEHGNLNTAATAMGKHLARARQASLGYVYWLQTECPREEVTDAELPRTRSAPRHADTILPLKSDTQHRRGYPEFRLRRDLFDTVDGCAIQPYIRESRRIRSRRPILEQEIVVKDFQGRLCRGDLARAAFMPDSVGVGHYALDIHPNGHGEPNAYVATRPFQIPLGALLPVRLRNLLPACKNLGTTHLTNGAYRLHPIEWNIGEAAGLLAAFCLSYPSTPDAVQDQATRRQEFQATLLREGIALHWYVDVPLDHPAFIAVQQLATAGLLLGRETDLLFRPDEAITPQDWQMWCAAFRPNAPADIEDIFLGTRAQAARQLTRQRNR